jgi:orotidine-5'-phosphate decarboxylase
MNSKDKIIVALDFADFSSAVKMVEEIGDEISFYKIGLEMMASGDYFKMIEFLKKSNKKIFADLKLYDIGQTVGKAVKNLTQFDIDFLTIHSANREIMMRANENKGKTKLLAVTVLTCLDKSDLVEMNFDPKFSIEEIVAKKAELALSCGIDGVVSSALETKMLRQKLGNDFLAVTPGIRLEKANDDQKRVANVDFALKSGASHLVVGRPITQSKNPREAAKAFVNSVN